MPKKPKGYTREGKPTVKEVHDLIKAKTILEQKSVYKAHNVLHPNSSMASSVKNAHRMLNANVKAYLENILKIDHMPATSKDMLEKVLKSVIYLWASGEEKTADMLKAVQMLKELVPEFARNRPAQRPIEDLTPEELEAELKKFVEAGELLKLLGKEKDKDDKETPAAPGTDLPGAS